MAFKKSHNLVKTRGQQYENYPSIYQSLKKCEYNMGNFNGESEHKTIFEYIAFEGVMNFRDLFKEPQGFTVHYIIQVLILILVLISYKMNNLLSS